MLISNHVGLWEKCLIVIKDNISETTFNTWFAPIVPLKYENKEFTIQVPSQFFYEIIENQFIDLLRMTLYREVGEGTKLMYSVLVDTSTNTGITYPGKEQPIKVAKTEEIATPFQQKKVLQDINPNLNTNYNFDNFIEGTTNKLARTAGLSIAKNPGKTIFNPLFLHGDSGVGKTHLAHAIGVMTKELHAEKKVLYVSANLFQQQFTTASCNNDRNSFLNFYQQIDVLIIDDIQEFASKTGTQDAVFHIFNYLHQAGKQLILTSDRSPVLLQGFENRLLSRFRWGLAAEIEKPDHELRKAILNNKIINDGLQIPTNVINYIAENVVENRDLEGVIISLLAHSMLTNKEIDLDLAQNVVSKIVNITPKTISVEGIRNVVCDYFNLSVESVMSKERKHELVQARQIAMYLSKQYTKQSLSNIGLNIGKRDHATVLHACKVISDQIEIDKSFRLTIKEIEEKIKK
jgi:chromosomal replication initiator protein